MAVKFKSLTTCSKNIKNVFMTLVKKARGEKISVVVAGSLQAL